MSPETRYALAADALLLAHVLFVLFVVLGLLLVFAGWRRSWSWVRNPWFRVAHLADSSDINNNPIPYGLGWLVVVAPGDTQAWYPNTDQDPGCQLGLFNNNCGSFPEIEKSLNIVAPFGNFPDFFWGHFQAGVVVQYLWPVFKTGVGSTQKNSMIFADTQTVNRHVTVLLPENHPGFPHI